MTFHTSPSYNETFTGSISAGTMGATAAYLIPVTGGVLQSSVWSTTAYAIPYNNNQFRLALVTPSDIRSWNATHHPVSDDGTLQIEFEIWQ